jgi:hypothetical protein
MHLRFPSRYIREDPRFPWLDIHPTWHFAEPAVISARFGGEIVSARCNRCRSGLHHLITLDPVPPDLGITSVPHLSLCTCLSCVGWEEDARIGYYQHDAAGDPNDITSSSPGQPQFPVGPMVETTVDLIETPPRWRWQDWAMSNSRQNLHRVGGHPCWVQTPDFPTCPRCNQLMPFLMQLDGDQKTVDAGHHQWGSGGLAYVHWCDGCRVSATFWQCT